MSVLISFKEVKWGLGGGKMEGVSLIYCTTI